jgi:hypothetical protein
MELFVREVNLRLNERLWPPMEAKSAPELRASINSVAYQLLVDAQDIERMRDKKSFVTAVDKVREAEVTALGVAGLDQGALAEASELSIRMLSNLYDGRLKSILLKPAFKGCGLVNACFGDALAQDGTVIEMKDGDRPYRSYEFRQIAVYAALHANSSGRYPSAIEVINSRRGVRYRAPLDQFAQEVAGQSGVDFLTEIVRAMSDLTASQ